MTITINNANQVNEKNVLRMIGRIDYLNGKGKSYDHTTYYKGDEEKFIQDIEDELTWDVDINVTLYRDGYGKTVSLNTIKGMRCQPKTIRVEDECVLVRL